MKVKMKVKVSLKKKAVKGVAMKLLKMKDQPRAMKILRKKDQVKAMKKVMKSLTRMVKGVARAMKILMVKEKVKGVAMVILYRVKWDGKISILLTCLTRLAMLKKLLMRMARRLPIGMILKSKKKQVRSVLRSAKLDQLRNYQVEVLVAEKIINPLLMA